MDEVFEKRASFGVWWMVIVGEVGGVGDGAEESSPSDG